jgi:hypothetical protein
MGYGDPSYAEDRHNTAEGLNGRRSCWIRDLFSGREDDRLPMVFGIYVTKYSEGDSGDYR